MYPQPRKPITAVLFSMNLVSSTTYLPASSLAELCDYGLLIIASACSHCPLIVMHLIKTASSQSVLPLLTTAGSIDVLLMIPQKGKVALYNTLEGDCAKHNHNDQYN